MIPPVIERVFVVNLVRRRDRLLRMHEQLRSAGLAPPVEFFRAVDALELSESMLTALGVSIFRSWKQPDSPVSFYRRDLKLGEIGCALSHLMLWRRIADAGYGCALILEDDAELAPDFGVRFDEQLRRLGEVMPDWDLCYAGRHRLTVAPFVSEPVPDEERLAEGLVIPGFSYCTHAYAVSARGAQRLLSAGLERNILPVDEFLPALYTHHPRADVRAIFGEGTRLRAAALVPELARQCDTASDTEASSLIAASAEPAAESSLHCFLG